MAIERFSIPYSQAAVDELRDRLMRTRWIAPSGGSDKFLREICAYWASEFDWAAQVRALSAWPHFRLVREGLSIHFIHARGRAPSPIPLILTHGWPGSFLEMLRIIPLLTEWFDVIVPSLPGYGFSSLPEGPGMNAFAIADAWADLMSMLGYQRFGAQGGDLGAGISTALGLRRPERMIGIHLNYLPGSYRPYVAPGSQLLPEEQRFLTDVAAWSAENGAYAHLQGTRPETAAYGLNDSPAGLAAWILEKVRDWSDCSGDVYRVFSRDELLANLTLYWMTGTIYSSFRLYAENRKAPLAFAPDDFVSPPCAIARFPKEISAPPRCWVERGYNVRRWTEMPRGGHFAAWEQAELLAADVRDFFRELL